MSSRYPFDRDQIPDVYVRFDVSTQGLTGGQKTNALTNIGAEAAFGAGTTSQYFRGDKSWQTLNTSVVPESGNLYYTDTRVRAALLTGYAVGTNTALAATDSILVAMGKIQGQLNNKQASGSYALASHTHTFAELTSKPTTLAGYGITDAVPSSRTITINGVTWDLSANRTWTISAGTGTVTSVTAGTGLTGGVITGVGTVAFDTTWGDARYSVVAHTHAASAIVSGTMATARLGSGTANSTVFLRGDSTWAQVSYSGLSGIPSTFTPSAHTHPWSDITSGKPTTLAGYGITDAVPSGRTITINGTTFDLSDNRAWTISTGSANDINFLDTRSVNTNPNATAYYKKAIFEFKEKSAINNPLGSTYIGLMSLYPWNDPSGGNAYQLAFGASNDFPHLAIRTNFIQQSAFGAWFQIWHAGDLPYPWRSVISNGNANTMTDYYTTYLGAFQSANRPANTNWVNVINHRYLDSNLIQQIGIIPGNRIGLRYSDNAGSTWTGWAETWTTQNLPNPLNQTSGTYTPVLKGGTTDPTYSATAVSGEWFRIGNLVWITARLTLTSLSGGSGFVSISLPSGALSGGETFDDDFSGSCSLSSVTFPSGTTMIVPDGISTSPTSICLRGTGSGLGSRPVVDISNLTSNSLFDINVIARVI